MFKSKKSTKNEFVLYYFYMERSRAIFDNLENQKTVRKKYRDLKFCEK